MLRVKRAIVVGTHHGLQRGDKGARLIDGFRAYLIKLCKEYEVKTIAEEINDQETSVAKNACQNLGVYHLMIDPSTAEYAELDIMTINRIQFYFGESKSNLESCMRNKHNQPRDVEWLKRINKHNRWPVLVVCGADHVEPFCSLLDENNIGVAFSEPYWGKLDVPD
jgi:hypothetical protein